MVSHASKSDESTTTTAKYSVQISVPKYSVHFCAPKYGANLIDVKKKKSGLSEKNTSTALIREMKGPSLHGLRQCRHTNH